MAALLGGHRLEPFLNEPGYLGGQAKDALPARVLCDSIPKSAQRGRRLSILSF